MTAGATPLRVTPSVVAGGSDFHDALRLAQSPDGRFIYADEFARGDGRSFVILQRDTETGVLRVRGCLGEQRPDRSCGPIVRVSADPNQFLVSPDGRRLAGVDGADGSVTLLERNRRSGRLTPIRGRRGCVTRTGYVVNSIFGEHSTRRLCRRARLPRFPTELAFAPDGKQLYVAGGRQHRRTAGALTGGRRPR